MLLLCVFNFAPSLLLTAMGLAGAVLAEAEAKFSSLRAMLLGFTILGLPLIITQVWVRRGRRSAMQLGLLLIALLLLLTVWLAVDVVRGPFGIPFKVSAGLLAFIAINAYAVGIARLLRVLRDARDSVERSPR